MDALTQLHFLRPFWALAVLPVAVLLLLAWNNNQRDGGGWRQVIDERLLQLLLVGQAGESKILQRCLMGLALVLLAIALAGPSWRQLPEPIVQNERSLVLVADLTQSMLATDIAPSRLERARYKMRDLLRQISDRPTGLIAFAGSSHVVAPVSDDVGTVENLLRALDPTLMPISGSRLAPALKRAAELIRDGGSASGDVLLLTDALVTDQDIAAATELANAGLRLSVIGIGTENGAPIPAANGQFVKRKNGSIVIASLDEPALKKLALAGGGRYRKLSDDNSDIAHLLESSGNWQASNAETEKDNQRLGDSWEDAGYWFVLPVLLLLALGARKGLLFSFILVGSLATTAPQPAYAQTEAEPGAPTGASAQKPDKAAESDKWSPKQLLQNSNQRAADKMANGQFKEAAATFKDENWRASALYEAGEYEAAAAAFSAIDSADANYNRGNALAKSGNLESAIEAYKKALEMQPDMTDAKANSQLVEQILEQKKQQQDSQQGDSSDDQQQDGENGDQQDGEPSDQQNGESSDQESGEQSDEQQQSDSDSQSSDSKEGDSSDAEQGQEQPGENQPNDGEAGEEQPPSDAQQGQAGDPANEEDSLADEAAPQLTDAENESAAENDTEEVTQVEADNESPSQQETARQEAMQQAMAPTEDTEPLTEQQQSLQQWLNRIPDDPGGLLRRKFSRQQQRRQQTMPNGSSDGDTRW